MLKGLIDDLRVKVESDLTMIESVRLIAMQSPPQSQSGDTESIVDQQWKGPDLAARLLQEIEGTS
jgi:hypothetical protein